MPKKRKPENKGLPERWRLYHGAYYYQVPPGLEHLWDGKKQFRLGKGLAEAYGQWTERLGAPEQANTIGQLLDRYALEVIPTKKASTIRRENQSIGPLRRVFGDVPIMKIEPQDIYKYVDKRSKKSTLKKGNQVITIGGRTTALHEVALLSHVYTKAVEWGYIKKHPFKGEIRLAGQKPRDRYITDDEIVECLALPSMRKQGSIHTIQAYIRVKLLTGLRRGDLLRLRIQDITPDGITVTTSKTGKPIIYEWSEELTSAIDAAKAARQVDISPFLFCNGRGKSYMNEENGTASGWDSMWQRFMDRLIKETEVTERFTEHDLRAKCASDAESLERARQLLAHADARTTNRIYRRKPERIKPAR